jgi:hypothetical protein
VKALKNCLKGKANESYRNKRNFDRSAVIEENPIGRC